MGIVVAFSLELYHLYFNVKQPSMAIEMYRSLLLWSGTAAVYLAARYDHVLLRSFRALAVPLAFIGVISYPLYLLHQDIGNMILHWAHIGRDHRSALLIRAVVLPGFLTGIAWLVYTFVERPTLKPLTAFLTHPLAWLRQWQPAAVKSSAAPTPATSCPRTCQSDSVLASPIASAFAQAGAAAISIDEIQQSTHRPTHRCRLRLDMAYGGAAPCDIGHIAGFALVACSDYSGHIAIWGCNGRDSDFRISIGRILSWLRTGTGGQARRACHRQFRLQERATADQPGERRLAGRRHVQEGRVRHRGCQTRP
ncbi:acyltransferase family protein [Bradyrhizobium sp. DN5]|uniref:acyltransferase family protein n=1 Tax=Bradyrhizobium sp. DN5 TaxID=3056950 RepID=UPI0035260C94